MHFPNSIRDKKVQHTGRFDLKSSLTSPLKPSSPNATCLTASSRTSLCAISTRFCFSNSLVFTVPASRATDLETPFLCIFVVVRSFQRAAKCGFEDRVWGSGWGSIVVVLFVRVCFFWVSAVLLVRWVCVRLIFCLSCCVGFGLVN